MKELKDYSGFLIGILFALLSLVLMVTDFGPIVSALLGMFLFMKISVLLVSPDSVDRMTILLLASCLILILFLFMFRFDKTKIKINRISISVIILMMSISYFIIHALGFLIFLEIKSGLKNDGQVAFGAVKSFPISSAAFVFIGLLIDVIRNKASNVALIK